MEPDITTQLVLDAYIPVTLATTAVSVPAPLAGDALLGGWSISETTGAAPAAFELWDGSASGGAILASVMLAANGCSCMATPGRGLLIRSGLWVNVTAGSIRGSLWLLHV